MPMPNPRKKIEDITDYISRFMSDKNMEKEFPDRKQRLAVAYSKWRESQKK